MPRGEEGDDCGQSLATAVGDFMGISPGKIWGFFGFIRELMENKLQEFGVEI